MDVSVLLLVKVFVSRLGGAQKPSLAHDNQCVAAMCEKAATVRLAPIQLQYFCKTCAKFRFYCFSLSRLPLFSSLPPLSCTQMKASKAEKKSKKDKKSKKEMSPEKVSRSTTMHGSSISNQACEGNRVDATFYANLLKKKSTLFADDRV